MKYDADHLFMCLIVTCIPYLVRCLFISFNCFEIGLLFYCWVLGVLLVNSQLSVQIFSPSLVCLLILLTVSSQRRSFLILLKPSLSILSFMDQFFLSWIVPSVLNLKRSCQIQCHLDPLTLSFRSFIVLHFTFRYIVHFELIFLKGVRSVSRFILLHVDI